MDLDKVLDFLHKELGLSTTKKSLKTILSRRKVKVRPGTEEEELCFRLIEESTGLTASQIASNYGLDSEAHKKSFERHYEHVSWSEENLTVLAGLLVYCVDGNQRAAVSYIKEWLGIKDKNKYARPSDLIHILRQEHPIFWEWVKKGATDNEFRERFENLIARKGWTIASMRAAYQKPAINWKDDRNQLLWAGLIRYCGLKAAEAGVFLKEWFGPDHPLPRGQALYSTVSTAMSRLGVTVEDVAPLKDATKREKRLQEFSAILSEKGKDWSIEKIQQAKKSGDFSISSESEEK